jgi:rubrerythrin
MATLAGKQRDPKDMLRAIIELDYDAIEAYQAAIDRIGAEGDKAQLRSFMGDHERHVREVGEALRAMGGTPPQGPDIKRVLTKGKVVIAGLMGDRAVLAAMKTNEDDTNTAYENATKHAGITADVRVILEKNLGDERRHRAWLESRLRMTTAAPETHPR